MRRKTNILILVLVALFCCALVPAASAAFTADSTLADGTVIQPGTVITVSITGLSNTNEFGYRITSDNLDVAENTVRLNSVYVPFDFSNGDVTTTLSTTKGISGATTLVVRRPDGSEILRESSNPITLGANIKKGTYDVSMSGTRSGGQVGINYAVIGKVENVNPANTYDLSFTVTGINSGSITIKVTDSGTTRFERTYTVSQPPTPPNPSGGSEGYGGSVPAAPAAPAAPQQQAPAQLAPVQGTTTTTATIAHNEQGQVLANYEIETDPAAGFSSAVSIDVGTTAVMGPGTPNAGQPVGEISVTPLDPATVTIDTATSGTFSFSGLAIECGPTGAQFTGSPVTISFTMTAAQWADAIAAVNGNIAAMTIQTFDPATNAWVEVPTVVDPVTHTVSAQVSHFSLYAVFYKSGAATGVKTIGELAQVTPFQPRVTTAAPAVTPAPTQMAPVATPTQQGGIFDGIINWFNSLFRKQ